MGKLEPRAVDDYYDDNTQGFLRFGGATRRTGTLHRSLALPGAAGGARSGVEAVHAVHRLLVESLTAHGLLESGEQMPLVADLGCGVGATMRWLETHAAVSTVGITVSDVQAKLARQRVGARVVAGSFECREDLARMAAGRSVDAAYLIEAFVHAGDADALFGAIATVCRPGSLLVIIDDFPTPRLLAGRADTAAARLNRRLARDFRHGWHIGSFYSAGGVAELAARHGWILVETTDLSPFVVTTRPRDYAARLGSWPARLLGMDGSFYRNIIGGSALQRLIRRRLIRYQRVVFRLTG